MNKLRVGVILGGMSSEREVSLNSGRNVHDNLDREAYAPVPVFMDGEGGSGSSPGSSSPKTRRRTSPNA
jgi:D-alanine-D-alanine ligase-like ATP-grasp enzyme